MGIKNSGILLVMLLFTLAGYTQEETVISGIVVDEGNEPVMGATVILKELQKGTATNEQGRFSFREEYAGEVTLEITYIGYNSVTQKITLPYRGESPIKITLTEQIDELEGVTLAGKSKATQVRDQAYTVGVIEAASLYNTGADINRVLNKTTGVRIREDGGLGSNFSFSLNGFTGKQVKFFLDGIPMDNFGSSLTLNNYPVNTVERMEVYKGVLPISLGADALGGAVNIITRTNPNYLDLSYGYGSFNTHRASAAHAYTNEESGFTVRTHAFYNFSDNNYKVRVEPIDLETGQRMEEQEVERFHDGYESATLQFETGVTQKSYADKLLAGVIVSGNKKDIQTGVTMDQVFGARKTNSLSVIPTLKYKKANLFTDGLDVSLNAAYNMARNKFIDTTRLRYNWLQDTRPTTSAELFRTQLVNEDKEALVSVNTTYHLTPSQGIAFNYNMNDFKRESSDVENPDNITFLFPQKLNKQILAMAWQGEFTRWNFNLFLKYYLLNASSFEQEQDGSGNPNYTETSTNTGDLGYGAAASWFLLENLQLKASFEHTYRLPEAVELLGDGLYTRRNSNLLPESSDNINFGVLYNHIFDEDHRLEIAANYLYRNSQDYIRLDQAQTQPIDRQYINMGNVLTNGVEAEVGYTWNDRLNLGMNFTYQSIIDNEEFISSTNLTGTITTPNLGYGYRIPNMPYMFGNAYAGYTFKELGKKTNSLNIDYTFNYVNDYYLTPYQLGANNQDIIPRQYAHNISANYAINDGKFNISLECRNLADNELFDNYRLQKPGRSFFMKLRYFLN